MSETVFERAGKTLYPWQAASWQGLVKYVETDRVPHALMIAGPDGIGKLNLALCFANYLLCRGSNTAELRCGHCADCRLIDAGSHPDLIRIEPPESGKAIPIDRIRELSDTLSLSGQTNRYRIVIISPADRLNSAAANALLKTLEEPGMGIVMMLLTARCREVPATIKSRCQRLDMPIPGRGVALDWLNKKIPSGDNEILIAMADGMPLKALEIGLAGKLDRRNALFSEWREIAARRLEPVRVAENLSTLPLMDVLAWITAWTIDMIRIGMVPDPASLGNPDLRPALQVEVERLDLKELFRFYDHLIQSAALIDSPVNVPLLLESILIDWYNMKRKL